MKKKPILFENGTGELYTPNDIVRVLEMAVNDDNIIGNNKKVKYYNVPCAFDIETTSFYRDEHRVYTYDNLPNKKCEKCAIMYVWQLGINGRVIIGRTWDEFVRVCNAISVYLHLGHAKRVIVYVHNLSYEFQFIRKLFDWDKVFSIDLRKPIYAITKTGIEFRCSYLLSGYSLAKLGEQLQKYRCRKMSGDLDYTLLRHSQTPLDASEVGYCVNDVRVVMSYIQERIEEYKCITRLPLTKTGFVRKHCRALCLQTKQDGKTKPNWDYINLIASLTISGLAEFNALQRSFSGGFTHANAAQTGGILENVTSYDFTSSYPSVMVCEQFPMSKGVYVGVKSIKQFDYLIGQYCCVFDIEFTGLQPRLTQDNPLSVSKCFVRENVVENNGRVVFADRVVTTITNVDYAIFNKFYKWKSMRVGGMWCYRRGYLPTPFVRAILDLYEKKTRLKGVSGKELEYLNSKEMLNSCYGMSVTNPLREEFTYNGQWDVNQLNNQQKTEMLRKYNTSRNRFLFYPWGVFVTAYARRNLFTGIYSVGHDYIYSDTDSIKLLNADAHRDYFNAYNNRIQNKLRMACKHHNIPFALCEPTTITGITKTLGVWDFDGHYTRFKTLGAKRYMVETERGVSLTVSGVNKKSAVPYLLKHYGGAVGAFNAFTNYLAIPPTATGKNIHTYIDYAITGTLTDYLGNTAEYAESTGVHLEPTGYTLSLSVMYINYLRGITFKTE